ncbi:MAG: HAD-IIIA family hydrolase [Lachnospiraceae bacterium]|nr:HAD-IIIA family hydrolase [Lachnospiraceae bacterium]
MIKLVVFDIDGVLTDGKIYVDENGRERKALLMTDVDAVNSIKKSGYMIAAITGEDTPMTEYFKVRFKWDIFIPGCKDKESALRAMSDELNIDMEDICYIGDGVYDIAAVKAAGFGICPQNAIDDVKAVADMVLKKSGGCGCIDELRMFLDSVRESE